MFLITVASNNNRNGLRSNMQTGDLNIWGDFGAVLAYAKMLIVLALNCVSPKCIPAIINLIKELKKSLNWKNYAYWITECKIFHLNAKNKPTQTETHNNLLCVYIQRDKRLNVLLMSGVITAEVNRPGSDWAKLKGSRPVWSRPLQTLQSPSIKVSAHITQTAAQRAIPAAM